MNPTVIEDINARKIFDSRGNPTIEVDVITRCGFGRAAAPSGASKGKYEVVDFPEKNLDKAINEVENIILPELIGYYSEEQEVIDGILKEVDGTENFSNIGGNTAVAISLANAKAAASSFGIPLHQYLGGSFATNLPYPLGNVIGGGAHAKNSTDIQEFLVIPLGARNINDALLANTSVHRAVREMLEKSPNRLYGKGDEGAWASNMKIEEALELLSKACEGVGNRMGINILMGMDVAASELWDGKKRKYVYQKEGKEFDSGEHIEYMRGLAERYNLYYVEDPMSEEDFEGFAELTRKTKCLICGDDLYVTNAERIRKGIKKGSTNAVLIKPNQCGTLTDTYEAINMARNNNQTPVISHRSGETTDETVAHLAVAFNCPIIKTGIVGGERIAKLNELIRISEQSTRLKMAKLPVFKNIKR